MLTKKTIYILECDNCNKTISADSSIRIRRYYSPMRPIGIGTCPKEGYWMGENFNERTYCSDIGREAWGYVEYCRPLTEQEISDYELIPDPKNS